MKNKLRLTFVLLFAIVHVHLNMFTIENFLNPSFWIAFLLESSPFGGEAWKVLSNIFILGVQCIVTSIVALFFLNWRNAKRWLLSYVICAFVFFLLWNIIDIHDNNCFNQAYDCIYGYGGAFKYCLIYSSLQVIYIASYTLIRQLNKKVTQEARS